MVYALIFIQTSSCLFYVLKSVERFDPETNSWEMVAPMADKRINFGVGVLHGFIYVVGGHNGAMHLSTVEKYDPHRDTWTTVMPMEMARTGECSDVTFASYAQFTLPYCCIDHYVGISNVATQ